MTETLRAARILMVEDNPAEADLMLETLSDCPSIDAIHMVRDGFEALEYLGCTAHGESAEPPEPRAPLPNLILLDLNLPRLHGQEVLAVIKKDPRLKTIPVLVLTSSSAESDIISCYELGAASYITKPLDLKAYRNLVKKLEEFWFHIVKLPPKPL